MQSPGLCLCSHCYLARGAAARRASRTLPASPGAALMSAAGDLARRLGEFLDKHDELIRRLLAPHARGEPVLDLDDLMQEVRIRVWRMLGDEKRSAYAAFSLSRIVASCAIDQHRKRVVRADISVAEQPSDADHAMQAPGPMQQTEHSQAVQRLQQELERLPERRRQPTALLLQGFTVDEIATIEGLSPATARNLAYRGINELQLRMRSAGVDLDEQHTDPTD